MMDAKTIFTTASVMVLANGTILAAIYRELPAALRPAASHWCLGTILVALGCVVFAFGEPLPRPLMLTIANAALVFGLTGYYVAIRRFHRLDVKPWLFLPAALVTVCIAWFSAVTPSFAIRMAVVTIVWTALMMLSVRVLANPALGQPSLARKILTAMFIAVGVYSAARGLLYLAVGVPEGFSIETGANWLNVLSAMLMTLLPVVGTTAFLLMCSDRLRRGLERAAATDYLTGLANRRSLAQASADAFFLASAEGRDLCVAIFDLDKFKRINDAYGHDAGDRALVHVANRLRDNMGPAGLIARTGGEEFVVLFQDLARSDAFARAERMRVAVEEGGFMLEEERIGLTVSAGLAFRRKSDRTYDDLLRRADSALYRAKANGRNRVEIAPHEVDDEPETGAARERAVFVTPPAISTTE